MKTTASVLLFASTLLSTTAAVPATLPTYKLTIDSENPKLKGSDVVLKDDSAANTFPNPLGSFNTGNPRYPYTFTTTLVSESDKLYELKSTAKQAHIVLNGDPRAPQLFETPIGGDPTPYSDKTITRTKFLIRNEGDKMFLTSAEDIRGSDGDFDGPGTWRACTGGTIDYQLYFFDGLSNLTEIVQGCETVRLLLDVAEPGASSTAAPPATTLVTSTSGYITGVPAPTSTDCTSGWLTGVPAPTGYPTSSSATPSATATPQITIRIFNDQTGANAAASVPADGVPRKISELFHETAIDTEDGIMGSSAQLVQFTDSTKCSLVNLNVRDWVIELDGRANNFVDLDGDRSQAEPMWLNGFTFQCSKA